jgi:hypothetical protein
LWNGLLFALEVPHWRSAAVPLQVVVFDTYTMKHKSSFGANVLLSPRAIVAHEAEIFVADKHVKVLCFTPAGDLLRVISPTVLRGPRTGHYNSEDADPVRCHINSLAIVRGHLVVLTSQLLEAMTTLGSMRQVLAAALSHCLRADVKMV